jgi:hypothetical protein
MLVNVGLAPGSDVMILKIFFPKNSQKNSVFGLNYCYVCKKIDHNIGFGEKRQFFRRKLAKIA